MFFWSKVIFQTSLLTGLSNTISGIILISAYTQSQTEQNLPLQNCAQLWIQWILSMPKESAYFNWYFLTGCSLIWQSTLPESIDLLQKDHKNMRCRLYYVVLFCCGHGQRHVSAKLNRRLFGPLFKRMFLQRKNSLNSDQMSFSCLRQPKENNIRMH